MDDDSEFEIPGEYLLSDVIYERQFAIRPAMRGGAIVYEDGVGCYEDDDLFAFTTRAEAEAFLQGVRFGQRRGSRRRDGAVADTCKDAFSSKGLGVRLSGDRFVQIDGHDPDRE